MARKTRKGGASAPAEAAAPPPATPAAEAAPPEPETTVSPAPTGGGRGPASPLMTEAPPGLRI